MGKPDISSLVASGWSLRDDGNALCKTYRFRSFRDAIAWMARIGYEAETLNHHPEWSNVYNRVDVTLTTHDTGGLSEKDVMLGEIMDVLAKRAPER